jgi:hypothetical protein
MRKLATKVAAMTTVMLGLLHSNALADQHPDLIIYNAQIITVDDHEYNDSPGTIAEAMAMRDGVIVAVGSESEVRALEGDGTRTLDLQGKTVMPGFVNVHHHPQSRMETLAREMFDLPQTIVGYYINLIVEPTPDETLAKIARSVEELRARADDIVPTDWIGIQLLPDGENYPDLGSVSFMMTAPAEADVQIGTEDLTEVIPDNPAILMSGAGIHIRNEDPGIWFRVTAAEDGSPVIEQLFVFEF